MEVKPFVKLFGIIKNYTKVCGKKCIVQTKPVNRSGINPKKLGYISPDGEIRFCSEEVAENYAKNRILKYLQTSEPTEFGVLIKGNVVKKEVAGTPDGVDIGKLGLSEREFGDFPRDISLLHGHPDMYGPGKTAPISQLNADLSVALESKLKSIVAYNSKGEFNKVEIPENFNNGMIAKLEREFTEKYYGEVTSKEEIGRFFELVRNARNLSAEARKELAELLMKFSAKEDEILGNGKIAQILHDTYKKVLPQFGIKYSTNFSNLSG